MTRREIDHDALKKRGFLRSRHEGEVTLRTRMPAGNYASSHLSKLSEIAQKYGRDIVHLTVRQGIEVPYIPYEKIDEVEKEMNEAGILPGASGPRLRATIACPGNNWCKRGLVDTFSLFKKLERRGIVCAMDLPHKFKIAISGCPNACTRVQVSEIGVHGAVDFTHSEKRIGYAVYLGGCGGKTPHMGHKLDKVYTEDEVVTLIGKVVDFYGKNAKPRQRLTSLIEEIGREKFLKTIGEHAG